VDDTRRDNRHGWHPTDPDPVAKYVAADGGLVEACRYCGEPTGHDGPVCYGCAHVPEPAAPLLWEFRPEDTCPDGGEWEPVETPAWLVWAGVVVALLVWTGAVLLLAGR
jgi:hypothetical protein